MLNILRFNLCVPTPYVFVVRFLKAAKSDHKVTIFSVSVFFHFQKCSVAGFSFPLFFAQIHFNSFFAQIEI